MVPQNSSNSAGFFVRAIAFGMPFLGCILGLVFCLAQSPQSKSLRYNAAAITLSPQDNDAAYQIALDSVQHAPLSPFAWTALAHTLQQKGDIEAAQNALEMAQHLNQGALPLAPRYAIPAQFKLSALSSLRPVE
jgi:predicted Zn-dependent protease